MSLEEKLVPFSDAQDGKFPEFSTAEEDNLTEVSSPTVVITNIEGRSHFLATDATRRLENSDRLQSRPLKSEIEVREGDERMSKLLMSHKPSCWFNLGEIRYRSFSEVEKNVTVLDTAWTHQPNGLPRLDRSSWQAQLDTVITHEGSDFQQRVDEKLESGEATKLLDAVFEAYVDVVLEKVGSVDLALLWVLTTHQFTEFTCEGLVTRLLAKGAKVTIAAKASLDTPLHLAAQRDSALVVKHLLQHKAPIMAVNREGKLPLEVAIAEGNDEVAVVLIKHMEASVVRQLFQGSRELPASLSFHALLENPHMQYTIKRTAKEVLDAMIEPLEGKEDYCVVYYSILDSDECGRVPYDPLFSKKQKSPLHIIAQQNKKEFVSHDVVRLLLRRKWKCFARYVFGLKFVYYLITLLALMLALVLAANRDDPRDYNSSLDGFRLFCEIATLILTLLNGLSEINEMRIHKWDYLVDYKNYGDVSSVLAILLIIPFRVAGLEVQWFFASLAYLFTSLRAFEYASVFRSTGAYVRILADIVWQAMVPFLAIFSVFLVSFSGAIYIAHGGELFEDTLPSSSGYGCNSTGPNNMSTEPDELQFYDVMWIGVRVMIQGGFVPKGNGEGKFSWLASVHYYIFLFIVVVVLLNLLIAHMSDTYASVQQDARHSLALNRAWIIARIEHNDPLATDYRKHFYESTEIVLNSQGLLERWEAPPIHEVNNRLQKVEKAFMRQEENLEELRATVLEKFNELHEQLQELGQLQRSN